MNNQIYRGLALVAWIRWKTETHGIVCVGTGFRGGFFIPPTFQSQ